MPSLPLPQLIGDARAQWLNGDPHAWTHYVACCLELEAELRDAQRIPTPMLVPHPETTPESPRVQQ